MEFNLHMIHEPTGKLPLIVLQFSCMHSFQVHVCKHHSSSFSDKPFGLLPFFLLLSPPLPPSPHTPPSPNTPPLPTPLPLATPCPLCLPHLHLSPTPPSHFLTTPSLCLPSPLLPLPTPFLCHILLPLSPSLSLSPPTLPLPQGAYTYIGISHSRLTVLLTHTTQGMCQLLNNLCVWEHAP